MTSDFDLGWAVGLFEGEGCISISRHRQRRYVSNRAVILVTNTDLSLVQRFHSIIGCGYVRPMKTTRLDQGAKQLYRWIATSFDEFDTAIAILRPHLSAARLAQLDRVLTERTPPKLPPESRQRALRRPREIRS